MHLALCIKWN